MAGTGKTRVYGAVYLDARQLEVECRDNTEVTVEANSLLARECVREWRKEESSPIWPGLPMRLKQVLCSSGASRLRPLHPHFTTLSPPLRPRALLVCSLTPLVFASLLPYVAYGTCRHTHGRADYVGHDRHHIRFPFARHPRHS